jgi:hypothetical protein
MVTLMQKVLIPVVTFVLGLAVCYVIVTVNPRTPPPERPYMETDAGSVLVSLPDPAQPNGRKLVRLTERDSRGFSRDPDDGRIIVPPDCWVIGFGTRNVFATPD